MRTLIVGGGLSGLALAEMLEAQGHDYLLLEARDRFGGRIKTEALDRAGFDMGPAWFWPGQPRIASLIERYDLTVFDQFSDGALTFEDAAGQVQYGRGIASMQGSFRLSGGLGVLTAALADRLPDARKRSGAPVAGLAQTESGIKATLASGEAVSADRVVLALPPRVAAGFQFAPELPEATLNTLQAVPTWMAGQAKAVAVYNTPFWRDAGLSGDAQSRHGPMVEIHDASPHTGGPYALFGFIGVPPESRADEALLRQHICAQLGRLFGPEAATPLELFVKDWARDPYTATDADQAPLYAHPSYGMPDVLGGLWEGRLLFSGTEVAATFGGYLEGALEAAEASFAMLTKDDG